MAKNWGELPFQKGDRVRTAATLAGRDYTPEGQRKRRPNELGVIANFETGHGLCFQIDYDTGGCGFFDPDELVLVPRRTVWDVLRDSE